MFHAKKIVYILVVGAISSVVTVDAIKLMKLGIPIPENNCSMTVFVKIDRDNNV